LKRNTYHQKKKTSRIIIIKLSKTIFRLTQNLQSKKQLKSKKRTKKKISMKKRMMRRQMKRKSIMVRKKMTMRKSNQTKNKSLYLSASIDSHSKG